MRFLMFNVMETVKINKKIFRKCSTYIILVLKTMAFLYNSTAVMFLCLPTVLYFWTNETQYILPFFVPLADENTFEGYCVICVVQILMICLAVFGTIGTDFWFFCASTNTYGLAEGFRIELNRLTELTKPHQKMENAEIKLFVRNIVLMHMDIRW